MQKITPFLWFDNNAEEAVNFYTSIIRDSKITGMARYGKEGPGPAGAVMTIAFELQGQAFIALNGGPIYQFTPAISFLINCDTQQEIDEYWEKLSAGGKEVQCGWLTDKFGLSWQVVTPLLGQMLQDKDAAKRNRVMHAMMQMVKIDIAALQRAYDQE
jgi:predicted 3-demethylubiquinone-9 3-methyltransferase (glyoxalase superfamily)